MGTTLSYSLLVYTRPNAQWMQNLAHGERAILHSVRVFVLLQGTDSHPTVPEDRGCSR